MAFEPISLADIYMKGEGIKGARQAQEMRGMQMDQMQAQQGMDRLAFMGRLAQAAKSTNAPANVFRAALPTLQRVAPQEFEDLTKNYGPNLERLDDAEAGNLTQYLDRTIALGQAAGGGQNLPAGFVEFQRTAAAAGLQPGTPEYEQAAKVALGLEGRASSAGFGFTEVKGPDGRTYFVRTDPRTGAVAAPGEFGASDVGVSPTEQESAQNVALGKGRGQAQAEKEKNAPKVRAAMLSAGAKQQRMENVAARIMPNVGIWTAGFLGSQLAEKPGTPAHDLKQNLSTLQALAGFKELQEMRDNSPTGGALGQVTENELKLLQKTYANIENSQSPEQLRENIRIFIRETQNALERVRAAYEQEYGSGGAQPTRNQDPLGIRS